MSGGRTSLTLYEGMEGMMENTFMNVKNRSKIVTAEIEVPASGASGALLVQGGRFGGWSLHLREGKPAYEYNWLGLHRYVVESPTALPAGKATVTLDFKCDGGGSGKGGVAKLSVIGKQAASLLNRRLVIRPVDSVDFVVDRSDDLWERFSRGEREFGHRNRLGEIRSIFLPQRWRRPGLFVLCGHANLDVILGRKHSWIARSASAA